MSYNQSKTEFYRFSDGNTLLLSKDYAAKQLNDMVIVCKGNAVYGLNSTGKVVFRDTCEFYKDNMYVKNNKLHIVNSLYYITVISVQNELDAKNIQNIESVEMEFSDESKAISFESGFKILYKDKAIGMTRDGKMYTDFSVTEVSCPSVDYITDLGYGIYKWTRGGPPYTTYVDAGKNDIFPQMNVSHVQVPYIIVEDTVYDASKKVYISEIESYVRDENSQYGLVVKKDGKLYYLNLEKQVKQLDIK